MDAEKQEKNGQGLCILWHHHHVSMKVKGQVCRAVVMSTLLRGAESRTVYRLHVRNLYVFMMWHLRFILKITRGQGDTKENIEQPRTRIHRIRHVQKESCVCVDATWQSSKSHPVLIAVCWSKEEQQTSTMVLRYHQENPEAWKRQTWILG